MKLCTKCLVEKQIVEFGLSKRSPDGRFPWCKSCRKLYDNTRYSKIGSTKWISLRKARLTKIKNWFVEHKQQSECSTCGESHFACLDYHHLDRTNKEDTVSNLVVGGASKETIIKEIKKCIVLCANCHRKLHYEENTPL